jgi:hypothetical protein
MKTLRILIFIFVCILLTLLVLRHIFPPKDKDPRYLVANVYRSHFNGIVNFIDEGRGFKVGLKNETICYDLSGTGNDTDTVGLAQTITWGDMLSKQANSDTIILKSKSNGKVSIWKLPADNKLNQ